MTRKTEAMPQSPSIADADQVAELDFESGDERSGRAGDRRPRREVLEEFPPERVREAGMTGGETAGRDHGLTADDLGPETLLDDDPSHTPAAHEEREALDAELSTVDASEIGGGDGEDEAELAQSHPIERSPRRGN